MIIPVYKTNVIVTNWPLQTIMTYVTFLSLFEDLQLGSSAGHGVVLLSYHILFLPVSLNYLTMYNGYLIDRGSYVCGQSFEWKN